MFDSWEDKIESFNKRWINNFYSYKIFDITTSLRIVYLDNKILCIIKKINISIKRISNLKLKRRTY